LAAFRDDSLSGERPGIHLGLALGERRLPRGERLLLRRCLKTKDLTLAFLSTIANGTSSSPEGGADRLRDSALCGIGAASPVFWSAGFIPAPWRGPRLVTRRLALWKGGCDPATAAHWRLSLGDLEVF
jgi:hypothetical protein